MGKQQTKKPVVIDLIDSDDSDIEIIHHSIMVLDDEMPPAKSGPSRPHQVCCPIQSMGMQGLIVIKRGIPSQPSLPAVKAEGTPLPTVEMEASTHLTDLESYKRAELDPSYGQVIASINEADSDTASEADDKYIHAKVCKSL